MQHRRGDHGPGLVRHLLAIVALPGIVLVVVPGLLLAGEDVEPDLDVLSVAGGVLLVAGLTLWTVSVVLFARIGRGRWRPGMRRSGWSSSDRTAMSAIQ